MGMLIDSVKNKSYSDANNIALMLIGILLCNPFFPFFRLSLFIDFTEHTLANLRHSLYSNLVKLPMSLFFAKRVGELNSRISSDITQIQDTLTSTIAEF
jgi:ABC-type bacteriocin/lantibiotic exporter with double-glycine peptidase domain